MNDNFPHANDNHLEKEIRTLKDLRVYARHLQAQWLAIEHSFTEKMAGVEGERLSDNERKDLANLTLKLAGSISSAEQTIRQYLSNLQNKDVPELRKLEDLLRFAKARQEEYRGKIQPL